MNANVISENKNINKYFYKSVIAITMPIALQNIISYSINLMDTVMLGKLGEIALSATSLANQIFFMFTLLVFGIGGGAVVLCSQYWGRKDVLSIQKVSTIVLKISSLVSLLFAIILFMFPSQIMKVFTSEAAVISAGANYLKVISISYLFYGITSTFLVILRSVETVNICLAIYGVSFFINILFNYIFIFGKFGAPTLGITGAAVGTVIARVSELLIILIYVFKFESKISYKPFMLKYKDKALLKDILRYGLPVICNELLWGVGLSVHSIILGHLGSNIVAANSICNVLFQMVTSFILGVSNASSVVMGKTVGSGDIEEAKIIKNKLLKIYLLLGIISSITLLIIKKPVISIYDISDETKLLANQFMFVYAYHILFMAFTSPIIAGIFRGGGDTRFAAFVDVTLLWILLPIGSIAAFYFKLNPVLVLMLLRIETPLKSILCMIRLKGDKWINTVTR